MSVETLSSLAFNSSLADASDSEVTAVSAVGLACVVLIFLSMLLVNAAGCSLTSMGVRANLSKRLPPAVYAALEPALYFLVLFLGYFLPVALLVGLAGMMSNYEPLGCWVYGSGILLGGTSMLLFLLGLGMWRARQWAVSGSVAAALALSALLPLVAQLFIVLQLPSCAVECEDSKGGRCTLTEFPYTAVTAISMALNSIPVIAIVFLRLGDGPSFPMQQHVPDIANSLLVVLGYRRSRRKMAQLVTLYGVSLLILAVYCVVVHQAFTTFGNTELDGITRWSGVLASLSVVMLDLLVLLFSRAGLASTSPVGPLLLMFGCRVSLVLIAGQNYMILLHAFLYLVVGSYVGIQVAIRRFRGGNMLDELVKAAASRPGGPKRGAPESGSSADLGAAGASPPSSPLSNGGSKQGSSVSFGAGVEHAADGSEPREAAAGPGLMALITALTKRAEFPLVFLWLTLGIEVVITSQLVAEADSPPKVRAPGRDQNRHEQYVFLLMVLLATIFFTLATSVYVRLVANNWQLSKVWILSVCTELVAGASAAILFVLMRSVNVVAVAVFAPPLLLFTAHAYHLWAEARATVFTGNVARDRQLLIEVFLVLLCIFGSTATTVLTQDAEGETNPQLGFITGFSVLVVLITRCAISKYFITFTFDMFSKVALVLAVASTGVALAILHYGYRSDFITYSGVGAGGYFAAELLVTSVFIWRSYDWRLSRTVALLIGSDLLLILAVIITLIVRPQPPFDSTLGLGLLMVWLLVVTSAGIGYLWSHRPAQIQKYPWLLPTVFCSLALILMLVAFILSKLMLAFTVLLIITTLSLLAYGLGDSSAYHIRSNFILPIWEYDSQKDVFRQANTSVLATFAGLWLLLLWAGFAVYTRVTTLPSLVSAFSVSLLYMYTMHAVHSDQTSLERLCKDLTPEMVAQAVTATKKQLAGRQSAPPAQSAVLVTVVEEASDKLLSDTSRVNFAHVTDTCSEDSMLQFGSPAHGQLNRVFDELHSLLCAALLELQGHTDVAKKKLAAGRSTPENLAALVSFRASLWTLQVEASAFAANLLMLLSMAAHYASAEQEKAMAGVLASDDGGKAAARIANWPRHQLALVTDMRAAWVAHGGGASAKRRKSASRLMLSMRPDQADSSGVDAKLGRTQKQVLTELATSSSTNIQQASMHSLLHSSSSTSSPELEESARFEDASFPPEAALDEAAKGAVCAGIEATPQPTWERAIDLVQELSLDDPVVFLDRSELLPLSVQVGTELETLADLGRADEENFGVALRLVLVQAGSAARVRRLFNSDQPNLQGVYSLQLYSSSRHRWETVLIDDRLPCKPQTVSQASGAAQPPQLLAWHARSTRTCELWIPLLHKAAAKFVGSYHKLAKMPVQNLVVMLVGGLLQSPLSNSVFPTAGGTAEAWQNLELWLKAGCLVLLEPKPQARKRHKSVDEDLQVSLGGDGSSVGLLKSWHLAVAVHSAGKVQLIFLQSPRMTRSPTAVRDDAVAEVGGDSTWRAQSFARASVRRGIPRDAQRAAKWLGILDVPLSCRAVHVVRSPVDWKETVLSGMVCSPASDQFAGLSASPARNSSADPERVSASQRAARNPRECKFQLHPVAARGEALEPPPPGMAIAVYRLDGPGGATSTEDIDLHVSMTSSDIGADAGRAGAAPPRELLAHSERAPLFFADAPVATMPTPPDVYVFTVALKGAQDFPDPVYFTALVHTPQRTLVSQYFSDKERIQAIICITREMRRWSDHKKLKKLKRKEFTRRKNLEEMVDMHRRFLEMLRVLRDLWRHEIFRLTHLEDNSSADDLVNSIFPSLDSTFNMSELFYRELSSCNHGYHPLISKQNSDHSGFSQILIAKLKEMRRKLWHAPASQGNAAASPIPEGAVRLEVTLSLSDDQLRAEWQGQQRLAEAFAGDLAAALKIPVRAVVVQTVEEVANKPKSALDGPKRGSLAAAAAVVGITMGTSPPPPASAGGAKVVIAIFDLLPQLSQQDSASDDSRPPTRLDLLAAKMAVNRRVDALAAALSLASDFNGPPPSKELVGPLAISTRAQQGAATRVIERVAGLRQVSADGQRTPVVPIDSEALLSSIPLSSESWVTLVQRFTPSKPVQGMDPEVIVRKAMTTARTEGCTVGQLSKVLHYAGTDSIGDVFSMYAQYFKVFEEYCNNLDHARNRVDACKKLEVFKRAFKQCQEDPRSKGMDLHNWLLRPNQHLMRQPLMLGDILGNTQKEHPSFSASKLALHKIEQVVGQVNDSKEAHESRLRLVQLQQRLRGDFEDLVVPARKLVREASVQEVARKATKGKANAAPDGDVEVGRHHSSFARVAGAVHHYAFLCNDSLWFCEVLRGNKYKVVHTFLFAAADTQATPPQRAQDANDRPQATTDVQQSGQFSFWVSDSTLSVHLRFAGGEDADVWVQAIEEATGVNAHQEDGALETGVVADDVTSPVEEQPGRPAEEEKPQAEASQASSLDATSVPAGLPKPSARYITQYRARHNLGRSASQVSVSVGGRPPSVGGSGGALLTKI